jgi:adenylate cyclase
MLALLCYQDYAQGFNLQADCLANALSAAQRAVALGPSNALAHWSLAPALYLHGEFQGFRNSAERAIALNPMDGNAIASLASMLYYQDPERGLELAARAKQFNPNHPGWYWLVDSVNAYFRGDYESAIKLALKTNLPKNLGMRVLIAAAYGQLGDREAASAALDALLKLRPSLPTTVRIDLAKWWQPWLAEPVIDGLRKAGLALAATEGSEPQS